MLSVRNARIEDLEEIVELHRDLDLGVISRIARPLLFSYFHSIVEHDFYNFRVAEDAREIIGYTIVNPNLRISRSAPFRAHPFRTLFLLIKNPRSTAIMFLYVLSRQIQSKTLKSVRGKFEWELYYIGIKKDRQRQGVGIILLNDVGTGMRQFEAQYLGFEVFKKSVHAINFYRKLNAEFLGEVRTGGLVSRILRLSSNDLA